MSKVENLKLREIKVLNEKDLMSLYSDYGSGSGSGSGSGPIFEDECQGSGDCGTYGVCESTGTWPFNKNRCRDMSSRERACVGLDPCERCRYLNEHLNPVDGQCSTAFNPVKYCTYQCYV